MRRILIILIASVVLFSCSEDEPTSPASKPEITSVTPDEGSVGDEVTLIGTDFGSPQSDSKIIFTGSEATEYPSWGDQEIKVEVPDGAVTGTVKVIVGVEESNEVDFTIIPPSIFETVTIGEQVWMLRNLDVAHYRNGDPIPQVTDPDEWKNLTTGAWCYYDNYPAFGEIYGKLYNWYAVNDPRGLAPEGWHVPSDEEWKELEDCLKANEEYWCNNNSDYRAKSLASTDLWNSSTETCAIGNDISANNTTGFTGRPGGYRSYNNGNFYNIGLNGNWWSSAESSSSTAIYRFLHYNYYSLYSNHYNKRFGYSVRCVRD